MGRENLTVELCWIVASGRISEPVVEHEEGKVKVNQNQRPRFQGNLPPNHGKTDANLGLLFQFQVVVWRGRFRPDLSSREKIWGVFQPQRYFSNLTFRCEHKENDHFY
ncbi:hypothetical protein EUTSA_v10002129mg [Eutrema salsugineum]|uniref:Uncharacterized protein n=1 Tax=Eutrema salsugineum TaxID=72664 RepID=V4M290_EUTSA|nr:hypothetical protein EUTSA_v10002129mg [Eutrema salsugineum]